MSNYHLQPFQSRWQPYQTKINDLENYPEIYLGRGQSYAFDNIAFRDYAYAPSRQLLRNCRETDNWFRQYRFINPTINRFPGPDF